MKNFKINNQPSKIIPENGKVFERSLEATCIDVGLHQGAIWLFDLTKTEVDERAKFVVKACNNFDALVSALADLLNEKAGVMKSCGHNYYCICPTDNAKQALKNLEL
jgi:hypothetical protein